MTNATNLGQLAVGTNAILGGPWYGRFIILIVLLVTFIYLIGKGYSKTSSLTTGCFISTIIALMLVPLGILDTWTLWVCIFSVPICLFVLWLFGGD